MLLFAPGAFGAPPRTLGRDITSADQLNETQQRRVRDYASYWGNELATSDSPEQVQVARDRLTQPLGLLNDPSPAFRFDYGRLVLQEIEGGAVLESDAHRAVNGILVVTQIGTESALKLLLDNCDARDQPATYVRGRAVLGCRVILVAANAQPPKLTLPKRPVSSALRRLRDAAKRETDVIILRHQLETLLAVDLPEARANLVEALSSVIDRIENAPDDPPSPLIEPSTRAVALLRNAFVELPDSERRKIGTEIGPCLGQLLETIKGHWQEAQDEALAKQTYGQAVDACEDFLKRIHATVRNGQGMPSARLKEAWDEGEKPSYEAGVSLWIEQLRQEPYHR